MQTERCECADAAAQAFLASNVPGDKERKLVVGKARLARLLVRFVQVVVEHVEAEVDHIVADDLAVAIVIAIRRACRVA